MSSVVKTSRSRVSVLPMQATTQSAGHPSLLSLSRSITGHWDLILASPHFPTASVHSVFFFNFYLLLKERDRTWVGEGQRERGRHRIRSRLQSLSCQHRAWCMAQTHYLWDHDLSEADCLTDWATQVPCLLSLFKGEAQSSFLIMGIKFQITCPIWLYLWWAVV